MSLKLWWLIKLLLTLKAGSHAGVAVGAVGGEGGAVSKDEAVLLLLQVAGRGAGRGLLTQLFAIRLALKLSKYEQNRNLLCVLSFVFQAWKKGYKDLNKPQDLVIMSSLNTWPRPGLSALAR